MQESAELLRRKWLRLGVALLPAVTERELEQFERRNGVHLPADFRIFLGIVNGMQPGNLDSDTQIRFWPLSEVRSVVDELGDQATFEDAGSFFVFADYSLWAHAYAIRLGKELTRNTVILVGGDVPITVADSFPDFLTKYINDPSLLSR